MLQKYKWSKTLHEVVWQSDSLQLFIQSSWIVLPMTIPCYPTTVYLAKCKIFTILFHSCQIKHQELLLCILKIDIDEFEHFFSLGNCSVNGNYCRSNVILCVILQFDLSLCMYIGWWISVRQVQMFVLTDSWVNFQVENMHVMCDSNVGPDVLSHSEKWLRYRSPIHSYSLLSVLSLCFGARTTPSLVTLSFKFSCFGSLYVIWWHFHLQYQFGSGSLCLVHHYTT